MGLSSFASKPIEDVIAANPKLFFQVYWSGGRDAIAARVERARQAGAVGLIVTTDWSFSHGRDWGSPKIPEQMNLRTMLRMSPEAITRPRVAVAIRQDAAPAGPAGAQPGPPRRARSALLRRLRRMDGHTAADLGGHRLAARAVGRPVHAQGRDAASTTRKELWTPVFRRSRCRTTAATTWTERRRQFARCPRSPRRSATRSKCCWTAVSGAAATSSRRWRWAPAR